MDYILGVDGGNTKTDYFLFDCEGNFIGMHRDGTCSHEALSDGFEGTRRVMKDALDYFLNRRKVKIEDIKAACFGLAGDDIPSQQRSLEEIIASFGFENFIVVNDSTLGIKAGTTKDMVYVLLMVLVLQQVVSIRTVKFFKSVVLVKLLVMKVVENSSLEK